MSIKEMFLAYVELQRNANDIRSVKGFDHPDTHAAYEKANKQKRKVLTAIEGLELQTDVNEIEEKGRQPLLRDMHLDPAYRNWEYDGYGQKIPRSGE